MKEIIGLDRLKRKVIIRKIGDKLKRSLSKVNLNTINSKLLSSPEGLKTLDDSHRMKEELLLKTDEKRRNSSFSSKFSNQNTPNNIKKKLSDKQLIQSIILEGKKKAPTFRKSASKYNWNNF